MKFTAADMLLLPAPSPPSRGAWIEISAIRGSLVRSIVAPLAGGVD